MRKDRILERDHRDYVRAERDVLTAVVHPYIVTLRYSFQARGAAARAWDGLRAQRAGAAGARWQRPPMQAPKQLVRVRVWAFELGIPPLARLRSPPPQTPKKLYLVLDFINGGHLFFQVGRRGRRGRRGGDQLRRGAAEPRAGRASRPARPGLPH